MRDCHCYEVVLCIPETPMGGMVDGNASRERFRFATLLSAISCHPLMIAGLNRVMLVIVAMFVKLDGFVMFGT